MTSFPASTPKLSVKDSFDEDEISDDIDDEVFIRDGRNGFKVDDERGAKRPLMAPRRKSIKSTQLHADVCKGPPCRIFCAPCCYGILALAVLLGVIVLVVYLVNSYPSSLNDIAPFWKLPRTDVEYLPCTTLEVKDVWTKSFPKLTTESAFRLVDVNKDGVLDVILGYGTGADGYNVPEWVCAVYFSSLEDSRGTGLCLGGLMALDGETGNIIWQRPMRHEVFGLDCSADLTSDSINDCLATGRGGVFSAVNSHDGSVIWEFGENSRVWRQGREVHSIFLSQYVEDMDGDGTQDVLALESGGSDSVGTKSQGEGQVWSRLWLVSGTGGSVLGGAPCPGGAGQSLTPPRVLLDPDGGSSLMVSISSLSGHGSLYIINLRDLLGAGLNVGRKRRKKKKNILKARLLFRDPSRGLLAPPALADLNGDGTEDIIVATCNSSVLVYDGLTLNLIWSQSLPSHSESFSSPAVAYYNEDDTPDIIIRFHTGPGFPMFYYSQVAILDGKNGDLLHGSPFVAGAGPRLGSPLSISLHGPPGHDMFIYWSTDCRGHTGSTDQYRFPNGTGVPEQLRSDICRLRYGSNSTQTGQLFAIGRYMSPPGVPLYNSEERLALEHNSSIDLLAEVENFLDAHPDFLEAPAPADGGLSELSMDGGETPDEPMDEGVASSQGEEENTKDIPYPNLMHSVRKHGWAHGNSRPRIDPWLNNWRKKRDISKSKNDDGLLRLLSTGTLAPSLSPRDSGTQPPKYIDLIFATHWIPTDNSVSGKAPAREGKAGRKALLDDIFIPMGQMTVYRVRLHCQCSLSKGKDPNLFECPSFAPFARQGWPSHMGARGNGYFRPRWS